MIETFTHQRHDVHVARVRRKHAPSSNPYDSLRPSPVRVPRDEQRASSSYRLSRFPLGRMPLPPPGTKTVRRTTIDPAVAVAYTCTERRSDAKPRSGLVRTRATHGPDPGQCRDRLRRRRAGYDETERGSGWFVVGTEECRNGWGAEGLGKGMATSSSVTLPHPHLSLCGSLRRRGRLEDTGQSAADQVWLRKRRCPRVR